MKEEFPGFQNKNLEKVKKTSIEAGGEKFNFLELKPSQPSSILILNFPASTGTSEKYIEYMYASMGKDVSIISLEDYSEKYSRQHLVDAFEKLIMSTGEKQNIVLHGISFGSTVVYDLMSDPTMQDFIKKNNVVGAILETPVLDKNHLISKARFVPDEVIMRGIRLRGKMREFYDLNKSKDTSHLFQEALRIKTTDRNIELPVHCIFALDEDLSDNEKITQTLQNQTKQVSFGFVRSETDKGHHIANDEYGRMWKEERKIISNFTENLKK